jgi:hypothetical protein
VERQVDPTDEEEQAMGKSLAIVVALVASMAASASAQQAPASGSAAAQPPDCAALIKQIRDQVGNRFDAGRHSAVDLAQQAEKLHNDKKSPECVAKAQEAQKAAGLVAAK